MKTTFVISIFSKIPAGFLLLLVWLTFSQPFAFAAQEHTAAGWSMEDTKPLFPVVPDNAVEQTEGEGNLFADDFEINYRSLARSSHFDHHYTAYCYTSYSDYHPELHFPPPNLVC